MTTNELAQLLGEKPKAVLDAVRRGQLKAEKVTEKLSPVGYRWNVTTPVEEARQIMSARVKRASPKVPRRGQLRVSMARVNAELPTNRDLFRPEEAAKYIGISKAALYKWMKDQKHETLRNGRSSYIPRAVVEKARETFRPKAPVVEAPRAQVPVAMPRFDPRIDRLEKDLDAFFGFLVRFAKSCGYEE